MLSEARIRSVNKSVLWRILGVLILAIVTYAYTREWFQTGLITFIHEKFTEFDWYTAHFYFKGG